LISFLTDFDQGISPFIGHPEFFQEGLVDGKLRQINIEIVSADNAEVYILSKVNSGDLQSIRYNLHELVMVNSWSETDRR
jgi:hypothetical protein